MLQQVMTNPGEITFREVPVPEIKDDQVLVKIMNIGICGSDIHVYHGKHPFTKYPVTQGHEVSGEITKIGKNVTEFHEGQTLEQFIDTVKEQEDGAVQVWENYLTHLALLISNLRMAYDMDIILGGEVGGYLADYMVPLGEKVMENNKFDHDVRYLKTCAYKKEASAVGAAKHFLQDFIKTI